MNNSIQLIKDLNILPKHITYKDILLTLENTDSSTFNENYLGTYYEGLKRHFIVVTKLNILVSGAAIWTKEAFWKSVELGEIKII